MTLIAATHDMSQGQRLARRVGVIIDGVLVQIGQPNDVFTAPQTPEIAEFVGLGNMLPGIIEERKEGLVVVRIGTQRIQAIASPDIFSKIYTLVRPEDITIFRKAEISSARNVLAGEIKDIKTFGSLDRIQIEIDGSFTMVCLVTNNSSRELRLRIGSLVFCSFKATAVRLIPRPY
jgi:tungstate transport system ATP-binding protein